VTTPHAMQLLVLQLCLLAILLPSLADGAKTCKDKDGKTFKVGKSYSSRCDVFTCTKVGKKYKFVTSFNSTHCCKHNKNTYQVGDMFNSTKLNYTCSTRQLKCVEVSNFTKPAEVETIYHHGVCCAYRHKARLENEYFDEFYNRTMLDRYTNFTLYLEVGENVTIPEKCVNLTCIQDDPFGLPALSMEIVHRACNCCYHNGSLYPEGARNITMEDGRNASCCGGELVLPQIVKYNITNSTRPGQGSATAPPGGVTLPPPTSAPTAAPDPALCWSSCFKSGNSYHDTFLEIVQKLQNEQKTNNVKGTCFTLDASLYTTTSPYMYKYERNLAMLLAFTLPISATNPMFVTKYMNYGACSWYDPAWCCQTDKCSAAKTLAGPTASSPPSLSTYQPVNTVPYAGMLWHGMGLAQQALTDTSKNTCAGSTSNQMVIPIVNKQWQGGVGGGGAYHTNWVGPGGFGRTVAAIGVDNALMGQLSAAATRPDLSWKVGSTQDWHDSLHSLLTCMDTACCGGSVAQSPGIPKSVKSLAKLITFNGTEPGQFVGPMGDLQQLGAF